MVNGVLGLVVVVKVGVSLLSGLVRMLVMNMLVGVLVKFFGRNIVS